MQQCGAGLCSLYAYAAKCVTTWPKLRLQQSKTMLPLPHDKVATATTLCFHQMSAVCSSYALVAFLLLITALWMLVLASAIFAYAPALSPGFILFFSTA